MYYVNYYVFHKKYIQEEHLF